VEQFKNGIFEMRRNVYGMYVGISMIDYVLFVENVALSECHMCESNSNGRRLWQ